MGTTNETLQENLAEVRRRIAAACARAGRDPDSVTLVAVTKTVDPATAAELVSLGVRHLGENRVQELERKHAQIGDAASWHMIGHLQRNKVRKVLPVASVIHSVDSVRLAEAIADQAAQRGAEAEVLLEVNVSGETSKFGFSPEDAHAKAVALASLPGLRLAGLMTMAPFVEDAERTRPFFRALRELRDAINAASGLALTRLSMGMTQDYEIAIEEGATLVRIGSALFRGVT